MVYVLGWGKLGVSPSDGVPFLHDEGHEIMTCGDGVWTGEQLVRDLRTCETR